VSSRTLKICLLALLAMALVMGVAVALTLVSGARPATCSLAPRWQVPAQGVEALKLIATTDERKNQLFVQDAARVVLLDADGGGLAFQRTLSVGAKTSLGDVDADGRVDLLLFTPSSTGAEAEALRLSDLRPLFRVPLALKGTLDRAVAVRLGDTAASGAVLRSSTGQLLAVGPDGKPRWTADGPRGELVTLDTVSVGGGAQQILCATKQDLSVVGADGRQRWQHNSSAGVRRARSLEPSNGQSVVVLAEESGALSVLAALDGAVMWTRDLGQPATELRLAELDGDPKSLELVVGGKKGGLWAFSSAGKELLSTSTGAGKISEIAALPAQANAEELLFIGGSEGTTEMIARGGKRSIVEHFGSGVERMLGGTPGGKPMIFIAADQALVARDLVFSAAPSWYSLLWAGAVGCLVIAVVAWLVARHEPARPLYVGAEQMTIEAQHARKIMLRESLSELKQLSSRLAHADLIARLRELREQMADADRRLLELGASLKPQIFACNRCGGPLEVGVERCEYCGSAVVG
jgi:outer membrane protein assembly factor BamB